MAVAIGVALPVRLLLAHRHRRLLRESANEKDDPFLSVPMWEFRADAAIWIVVGTALAFYNNAAYGAPWTTGAKVLVGCVTAGTLCGMFNFLTMESEVIEFRKTVSENPHVEPGVLISVSRKMVFLLAFVLTLSGVVTGFMVINDVSYLVNRKDSLVTADFYAVFYEAAFVIAVMIFFGLAIVGRFSKNLKSLFNLQLDALEKVENGVYNTSVPIVSNDEFGVMGRQINKMISGLRERNFIRDTFGRYLPREISDLIIAKKASLNGELREVTILFCDLRDYTPFVEASRPQDVVLKLNRYFTEMSRAIHSNGGLVLQYIGDEIEAVFGAPAVEEGHPELAVRAALEMRKRLVRLNEEWEAEDQEPFHHGIGIHTGEALAGNIGSPERLSYTLVGDTVNLASRVQGLTKELKCDILATRATVQRLTDDIAVANAGESKVKGRVKTIEVFKVQ